MAIGAAERFEDSITDLTAANFNGLEMGGNVYADPAGGLKIAVTAIRGLVNSAEVSFAGASAQAVSPSTTNYVYLDSAGSLQINTTGFPNDYPTTRFFPLATVVTNGAGITSITDRRWRFSV